MLQKYISLSLETLSSALSIIEEIFPYRKDQKRARENLIESLSQKNPSKSYWVANAQDGKVIGITGLCLDDTGKESKPTIWLGWFGVHPAYRRRGIGSSLLEFTINEAKKRDFKTLRLYTSLDKNEKAAHRLYERFGFRKTCFYRDTETVYYTKDLTEKPDETKEGQMEAYKIPIEWEGPYSVEEVINDMDDEGEPPDYDGEDYGLYQIYGRHILCGPDTLLYVGKATQPTFSRRFREHKKDWLDDEEEIQVYLGRVYDPKKHTEDDHWKSWERDICLAESILIYKYSPNYNNTGIGDKPSLRPFTTIKLNHRGERHRLEKEDNAPEDYS